MQHIENTQISRTKKKPEYIWLFCQCLLWIHVQKKRPSQSNVLKRWEQQKKMRKRQWKQRDKGRKIVKYKEILKLSFDKHSELPKQMYSNTLFETCFLSELCCCCWEPTRVIALRHTLNLLDPPIWKVFIVLGILLTSNTEF